MDMRWWVWIALAVFAGLLGYIWVTTPKAPPPAATVLSQSDLAQTRMILARVTDGLLEYRRVQGRLLPHHHQDSHTFSYVLSGRAVGFLHRQSIEIKPGYLLLVPRQTAIGLRIAGEEPLELLTFYTPLPSAHDEVQTIVVDLLPPGDPLSLSPEATPPHELNREVMPRVLALDAWRDQALHYQREGFAWSYLSKTRSGSAVLVHVRERLPLQEHGAHFLYLLRGHAKITAGEKLLEAQAGQIVLLPAGVARLIERVGEEPLELLLFSAPALREF